MTVAAARPALKLFEIRWTAADRCGKGAPVIVVQSQTRETLEQPELLVSA